MNKIYKLLLIVFSLIMVVVVCTIIFVPSENYTNHTKVDKTNEYEVDNLSACYISHQFVEKMLKAPSTAIFQDCFDAKVAYTGNKTYFVYSYVDSQNSFGAMLRTEYIAQVQQIDDRWRLLGIITDDD